jgi:hypothetical protein
MTEQTSVTTTQPKRECRLCGYPSTDYRIIPVPLSSPPQDHAVCADCLEELTTAVAAERDGASLAQGVTMDSRDIWTLATEHLPERVSANTNLASTTYSWFQRLSQSIKEIIGERDEARKLARFYKRVLLENYNDVAVDAMFAEDDCYYGWLCEDDNGRQEQVSMTYETIERSIAEAESALRGAYTKVRVAVEDTRKCLLQNIKRADQRGDKLYVDPGEEFARWCALDLRRDRLSAAMRELHFYKPDIRK